MRRNQIVLLLLLLLLQAAPYGIAGLLAGDAWVFGGFLLNPLDGNSYLAKMQTGWEGAWRFQLIYSPEHGDGRFLFFFYLFLGHLARWTGLSVLVIFHAARLLAVVALFFSMQTFARAVVQDDGETEDRMLWLAGLGGGMGWLVALTGGPMTGDFWVAEAYPFLSMYANPHFPLGLALILLILALDLKGRSRWSAPAAAILGLLLAIIQPFGLVVAAGMLSGLFGWRWLAEKKFDPWTMICGASLGGVFLVYQLWLFRTDPLLKEWDKQNLTLALPVWDTFVSLMPALLFAIAGIWAVRRQIDSRRFALVFWLVLALVLVNVPFNLQRRFMVGLYVPVAFLGAIGVGWAARRLHMNTKWVDPLLLGLSVLTNLLIVLSGILASLNLSPGGPPRQIFLPRDGVAGMHWLKENSPTGSVVLADDLNGLFIPAWAGRQVVYGHPYESIHAAQRKQEVARFFAGEMNLQESHELLEKYQVNFIYLDRSLQPQARLDELKYPVIYRQGEIVILQVVQ